MSCVRCTLDLFWGIAVIFPIPVLFNISFNILEKITFQWLGTQKQMLILWPLSKQGKISLEKVKTFLSVDNVKYTSMSTKEYGIFVKVYKIFLFENTKGSCKHQLVPFILDMFFLILLLSFPV